MLDLQETVPTLPIYVLTLKKQVLAQLLLLALRKKTIPLEPRQLLSSISRKSKEDLIFFDPVNLFTRFVGSNISRQLYLGLSKFYNLHLQDELYKSNAWTSSIRTISRQFAYY